MKRIKNCIAWDLLTVIDLVASQLMAGSSTEEPTGSQILHHMWQCFKLRMFVERAPWMVDLESREAQLGSIGPHHPGAFAFAKEKAGDFFEGSSVGTDGSVGQQLEGSWWNGDEF